MPLKLDLQPGDVVRIGTATVLRVESKSGNRTRLSIESEYRVEKESPSARRLTPPMPTGSPVAPGPPIKRPPTA